MSGPDSGGYNPGIEIAQGVLGPGDSIQVPEDPSLCGMELRVTLWTNDNPPIVIVLYYKIVC